MNKNILLIIILVLVIIIAGFVFYMLYGNVVYKEKTETSNPQPASENTSPAAEVTPKTPSIELSEQPNKAKFNEYLTGASVGKISAGEQVGPMNFTKTNIFYLDKDQFCTSLDVKKEIKKGTLSLAIYDVEAKEYIKPKTVFGMGLKTGNSTGCENIDYPSGQYEQKIYIDDILAVVLPFEVR